jgi:predicted DNA binding CopG/RHH family protein
MPAMDIRFELAGEVFIWDSTKAEANWRKHGVRFEEAATVPLVARSRTRKHAMRSERLKKRLSKDRPMTTITLRIPVDVVESLKEIAPLKGLSGYQTLLKSYISEGLRRDEAQLAPDSTDRLIAALRKRGVPVAVLEDVARELATSDQSSLAR